MRRHVAGQLVIEGPRPDRIERPRIDLDGAVSFFERQQFAAMRDDVGIRDAVGAHPRDFRIRVARIARRTEQRAAGRAFERPLLRAHPTVAIGHASIRDVKRVDHAVGLQRVVPAARRELRIRTDPVQRPVQLGRKFAVDEEIGVVALHADRLEATLQERVIGRKRTCHRVCPG